MKRSALWIVAILVVVAVIGVVVWMTRKPAAPAGPAGTATAGAAPHSAPQSGQVLLVEYSDFQCPSCAVMFPLVRDIHREYEGRIQFVYRNLPLRQIHMNAERAAWAAEAARQQGKFWEMADVLFQNQTAWSALPNPLPAFEQYARSVGLDVNRFTADFDGFVVHSRVENDVRLATEDRIQHTPTVLLNGQEIKPRSYAEFRNMINEALAKSEAEARVKNQ
jgi:protein-disulfide isomerase